MLFVYPFMKKKVTKIKFGDESQYQNTSVNKNEDKNDKDSISFENEVTFEILKSESHTITYLRSLQH